jgi:hypothetical protein
VQNPGNELAARFGLCFRMPDYLIEIYRDTFNNDLTRINGDSSWTLLMPGRFVVGSDGVNAYAEANVDYTLRPDPNELLLVITRTQTAAYALRDSRYSVSA